MISIRDDTWINDLGNFRLIHQPCNDEYNLVVELIDENKREWKKDMVLNTFCPEDAARILQISLAQIVVDDQIAWQGEASGEFSIRSAYRMLQNSHRNHTTYTLQPRVKLFYKHMWGLDLPNKVKILLWKAS